jgi:hypothetical protein
MGADTPRAVHGGVMFRVAGELCFLPASVAMKLMPTPEMARVPGGPPELRGVALVDGNMIPVVDVLGDRSPSTRQRNLAEARVIGGAMLVCSIVGELVGLVGIDVVATGFFDVTASGAPKLRDEAARSFDLADAIARVREGRWAV